MGRFRQVNFDTSTDVLRLNIEADDVVQVKEMNLEVHRDSKVYQLKRR